jgi:hypothetical protein
MGFPDQVKQVRAERDLQEDFLNTGVNTECTVTGNIDQVYPLFLNVQQHGCVSSR